MSETQTIARDARAVQASFMSGVYSWMFLALLVTGVTAFLTVSTPALIEFVFGIPYMFMGLVLGEFALVWYLSARVMRMSNTQATLMFLLYSLMNGLTLSVIFLVYSLGSIGMTFFICAATFGVMSVAGYVTKNDLSTFGGIMFMGLIGVLIASLVNFFLHSETLSYIISYVGVMVFVGLTAYDTQKLKNLALQVDDEQSKRASIMGALTLYLDFINLFLFMLRIFGGRK